MFLLLQIRQRRKSIQNSDTLLGCYMLIVEYNSEQKDLKHVGIVGLCFNCIIVAWIFIKATSVSRTSSDTFDEMAGGTIVLFYCRWSRIEDFSQTNTSFIGHSLGFSLFFVSELLWSLFQVKRL